MAQGLKTDSVYCEFWLLISSGNSLQWTKLKSLKHGKPVGPGGGKKPWPKLMQEVAVKWWGSSGQYSTPEEADAGSRKSDFSLKGSQVGWYPQCLLTALLGPQDDDRGICPKVGRMRGGNEDEGKAVLVRNHSGVLWSSSKVAPPPCPTAQPLCAPY